MSLLTIESNSPLVMFLPSEFKIEGNCFSYFVPLGIILPSTV